VRLQGCEGRDERDSAWVTPPKPPNHFGVAANALGCCEVSSSDLAQSQVPRTRDLRNPEGGCQPPSACQPVVEVD
jgi:hypothetical protein